MSLNPEQQSKVQQIPKAELKKGAIITIPSELTIEQSVSHVFSALSNNTREQTNDVEMKGAFFQIDKDASYQNIYDAFKKQEFNAFAERYLEQFIIPNLPFYNVVAERIRQETHRTVAPTILDIGAGTGFVMPEAFDYGKNGGVYIALEPAIAMLDVAEHKAQSSFSKVHFVKANEPAAKLNDPVYRASLMLKTGEKPLDFITCVAALHVLDKSGRTETIKVGDLSEEILRNASTLLKPDGLIIVGNYYHRTQKDYESFRDKWIENQRQLGIEVKHQPTPPEQLFTPQLMTDIFERFGFSVVGDIQEAQTSLGIRGYVMVAKRNNLIEQSGANQNLIPRGINDSETYHANSGLQNEVARKAIELLGNLTTESILDVGCGTGIIPSELQTQTTGTVVGIDVSETQVALAQNEYPQVQFLLSDVTSIQYNGAFDLVTSFNAMHWVVKQKEALSKMFDALKPLGRLLILTWGKPESHIGESEGNFDFTKTWEGVVNSDKWQGLFPNYQPTRIHFNKRDYENLLSVIGFTNVSVEEVLFEKVFDTHADVANFFCPLVDCAGHLSTELKNDFIQDAINEFIRRAPKTSDGKILFQAIKHTVMATKPE